MADDCSRNAHLFNNGECVYCLAPEIPDPAIMCDCGGSYYTAEQVRELVRAAKEQERERAARICDEMGEHWSAYKDTALLNGDVALSNAASGEPRAAEALARLIRKD